MKKEINLFLLLTIISLVVCSSCSKDSDSSVENSLEVPKIKVSQKGVHHLKRVDIIDSNGFGRVIPAASVLVPVDWKTQGGIVWKVNNTGCGRNGTTVQWAAASPDESTVVEILPEETWTGNNLGQQQGQCPNLWITNAREYLLTYVKYNRSTANVRSYRDRTDIAEQYKQSNSRTPTAMGEIVNWVEAGEVLLDYNYQGQAFEEVIVLMINFNLSRMQGVYQGEIREFLTMTTVPGFAMRAPAGKLNLKLAEAIRTSGKPYPEWLNLMAQHNAKMRQINMKGAADRHKIRMDTQREIAAINQKTYENTQRSQDRSNEKFNQMIRGVETYHEPDTNTQVELPYTHKNAWKLSDDTYILTDDHNFEPYRDLGIDGTQLKRAQ